MNQFDAIDAINEVCRRIEGIAALIGQPATMQPEGVSFLVDLLREEAGRLRAVTEALDPAASATD
ncbi:hypothetical protein [Thiocapsa roseopersicina]|uniref:Uncharacterized protein n=1 Tax=Thiocapsa roseopersicina TaxID=1058 RepID=A0A1H3DCU9_THIRO|nr:hypothetical protein [Thiocapsa roseopersicina]SDX64167.1 hypothetical protein SAMN05421783_14620 [Thiocapsa roseopersicina]